MYDVGLRARCRFEQQLCQEELQSICKPVTLSLLDNGFLMTQLGSDIKDRIRKDLRSASQNNDTRQDQTTRPTPYRDHLQYESYAYYDGSH